MTPGGHVMTKGEKKARARLHRGGYGLYLGQAFLYVWRLEKPQEEHRWPANQQMTARERIRVIYRAARELKC